MVILSYFCTQTSASLMASKKFELSLTTKILGVSMIVLYNKSLMFICRQMLTLYIVQLTVTVSQCIYHIVSLNMPLDEWDYFSFYIKCPDVGPIISYWFLSIYMVIIGSECPQILWLESSRKNNLFFKRNPVDNGIMRKWTYCSNMTNA